MFFESALQGKNAFWRYLIMFIAVFAATNTIGALPLITVIVIKGLNDPAMLNEASDNLMELSAYGIDPNTGLVLMLFPFIIGIVTLYLLIRPLNSRPFINLFNGGGKIRWKKFFSSAFVWLFLMSIYLLFSILADPDNFELNNVSVSLLWLIIIALLLVPFQASFEELLFRGYLMQGAGAWFRNKWMPLLISSLLFGLMHSFNPEIKEFGFWLMMPQYVVFGIVFGLITILDDGIEMAMGAHTVNNIFLSVFLTQESSALQTPALFEQQEVYPLTDFLSLFLISGIFILLMWIMNRWRFKDAFRFN